jgi:hypothetical protein
MVEGYVATQSIHSEPFERSEFERRLRYSRPYVTHFWDNIRQYMSYKIDHVNITIMNMFRFALTASWWTPMVLARFGLESPPVHPYLATSTDKHSVMPLRKPSAE